jgi:hypothetical protein
MNLKYRVVHQADDKDKVLPRITKEAFRKQVSRLEKKSSINENMQFGIRGNILLLMNIFEILEIKTVDDLLGSVFSKPNIETLIIEANINSETIKQKIEALQDTITLSMKHKPRIPNLKVWRDWELILAKMLYIINMEKGANPIHGNITWGFYNYLWSYANQFTKEKQIEIGIAIYTCTLLNEHKEYFTQDILLHRFVASLLTMPYYNGRHKFITLVPLYLLYFFFLCQRRFINTFLQKDKKSETNKYNLFIHQKYDEKNKKIESKNILNILGGKSLSEYINNQNNEMQNTSKKILELFENYTIDLNALRNYCDISLLMYEIISFFSGIYSSHVDYTQSHFFEFIKQIGNLNDLFTQLSLGNPLIYLISEDHINSIASFNERLGELHLFISKLAKG